MGSQAKQAEDAMSTYAVFGMTERFAREESCKKNTNIHRR